MNNYLYLIVVFFEDSMEKFEASFSSDWDVHNEMMRLYPQARLIVPRRLGRVQ